MYENIVLSQTQLMFEKTVFKTKIYTVIPKYMLLTKCQFRKKLLMMTFKVNTHQ